jgi:hypothetical protein
VSDTPERRPGLVPGPGQAPAHGQGQDARRFELPSGLRPEDEWAILAALERYFEGDERGPDAWTLAGRLDATGMGALQTRRVEGAWRRAARFPFARTGVAPLAGRGDAS